jgi:hypothetical protein
LEGYNELLTPTTAEILSSTNRFSYKLKLPYLLKTPCADDVLDIKVNGKTSPGGFTKRFYRNLTGLTGTFKQDVAVFSHRIFVDKWRIVVAGGVDRDHGYYSVGGREKVQECDVSKDVDCVIDDITGRKYYGNKLGTRPVMIPEFHDIMFDSVLLSPIMRYFKAYGADVSEVWVGHSLAHLG